MLTIDKNIPMPPARREYGHYPFADMEVGDSFFLHDLDGRLAHRLQTQISFHKRRTDDPRRFVTRRETDGIRCWRTA